MTDLFLLADSRAAMYAGLYAAGLMVEIPAAEAEGRATHAVEETVPGAEGEETVTRYFVPVTASHGWALDDAVLIVTTTAVIHTDTGEATEAAGLDSRYQVNPRLATAPTAHEAALAIGRRAR